MTLDIQNRFGEVFSRSLKRGDIDWIPDAATHAPEHATPRQGILRYSFSSSSFSFLITSHQSAVTNHQSLITNHSSIITNHQSQTFRHQSSITDYTLITNAYIQWTTRTPRTCLSTVTYQLRAHGAPILAHPSRSLPPRACQPQQLWALNHVHLEP